MNTRTVLPAFLLAALLSAQAAADCGEINFEAPLPGVAAVADAQPQDGREQAVDSGQRRQAYLDCLKPEPFVQERIVIEMDDVADEFSRERFLERAKTVAAASR